MGCGGGPSHDEANRSQKEYELAVGLWHENNMPAAFQHLFRSIELDSDNAKAHLLLGNFFLFRREDKKAEQHFREVLRIEKRSPEARNSLGVLYIHQKRYDEAIAELRVATADLLNREPHLAWGNLGWAYSLKHDHAQAIDALAQAVRYEPKFCVGRFRMGLAFFALKKYMEADRALTGALETPDAQCQTMQEAWFWRGHVRSRLGEREQAIHDFERCVEIGPETTLGEDCKKMLHSVH